MENALGEVVRDDLLSAARTIYPDASNETLNRQVIAPGSAVLHYAADNEWAPYRRIRRLPEREPENRRPAPGTLDLLIANTDGKKRLLLLFFALQGPRHAEALGLRVERTNLSAGTYEVYVSKSKRWKTMPLHDEMVAELANAEPEPDRYWFPWRSRSGVYKWLRPLCRKLGVRFTPHMARYEFGGGHREAGATSRDLVDIGTWTSVRSTERYQGAPTDHARNILHNARGTAWGTAAK